VLFAGQHISKSPFEVEVGMAQGDSTKATAQGPGLELTGNIANKATYFDVYTAGRCDVPDWCNSVVAT
jgi:filamin